MSGDVLDIGGLPAVLYRVTGGYSLDELPNLVIRFRYSQIDHVGCAWDHVHKPGTGQHTNDKYHASWEDSAFPPSLDGDWSPWYLVSALRSGNVAVTSPADPDPVDPAEPEAESPADDSAELARLRATVSALRDSLRAAGVWAAALRGALLALQAQIDALQSADGTATVTLIDTVEVARVDTVHFCPPTDEDRQALFDAFTGLQDSTAAAPKAAVQVESWGAIKALVREE